VYFKVIKEGDVKAGNIFVRTVHKPDNPTIAEVYKSKRP